MMQQNKQKTIMKQYILGAMAGAVLLCSGKADPYEEIRKADWLLGTWANHTQRGIVYESWSRASESELSGRSYMLRGTDTVLFESVQILQEPGTLFYVPRVANQNNGQAVRFQLHQLLDDMMVFQNRDHDFPQWISYQRITPDSLVAVISGTKNGKIRRQTFPMKRVK